MAVGIVGNGVVFDEVPTVNVVDVAVSVIVYPVVGYLVWVGPDSSGQVGMGCVDAGVYHGYHHVLGVEGRIPGCGSGNAVGIEQSPEIVGLRVVAPRGELDDGIEVDVDDDGMLQQCGSGVFEIAGDFQQVLVGIAIAMNEPTID